MRDIKIGDRVKVKSKFSVSPFVICKSWTRAQFDGKIGTFLAIAKEGRRRRDYLVQFEKPANWCIFKRNELRVVTKGMK